MKDHSGCQKGFVHFNEAWYSEGTPLPPGKVDEVTVGFFSEDGGTTGEFQFEWTRLAGRIVVRLKSFDDSWSALRNCSDLLDWMAKVDDLSPSPEEFCAKLVELGYNDLTKRER